MIFDGLNIQNIASVTPGIPKPPPIYAGEGTLNPEYPDRGDVPTNLANATKNTNNPSKPIPGLYKPPEYIVATSPTSPNGNASNPGSFVRPEYIPNIPLGPLANPPDNGNEFVPAVPPVPPRPPTTAPPPPPEPQIYQSKASFVGYSSQSGYDGFYYQGSYQIYYKVYPAFSSNGGESVYWHIYLQYESDGGLYQVECKKGYKPDPKLAGDYANCIKQ